MLSPVAPMGNVSLLVSICRANINLKRVRLDGRGSMVFSTYIDWLPTYDIIHEFIFPYLDYEDRIQFNQFLPREERLIRRIDKMDALMHDTSVSSALIRGYLDIIGTPGLNIQKKSKCLVTMLNHFRPGKRGTRLVQHLPKMLNIFLQKLTDFLDPESDSLDRATRHYKKKIRGIAAEILPEMLELQSVSLGRPIRPLKIRW